MALDIDWSQPRRVCETPGCGWPSWHICLIGKPNLVPEIIANEAPKKKKSLTSTPRLVYRSDEWRQAISIGRTRYWEAQDEVNRERNEKLVARYAEGNVSQNELAKEFRMAKGTVNKILVNAARKEVQCL